MSENEMREIRIQKAVVNIGESEVGDDVEKAVKLLEKITGKKPVKTESKPAAKTFGKRGGLKLGAKVTLRGEEAQEFIERVIQATDEELSKENFDGNGNFGFGVSEYIDVPGVDYDSDIGMKGFEVAVKVERPGYRVKRRDHKPTQVGKDHEVTDKESIEFVENELGIEVKE